MTFLCTALRGEPSPGAEAIEAGWFSQTEAATRVTHPAQAARLQDTLKFGGHGGEVIYRVYRTNPYELISEHRMGG